MQFKLREKIAKISSGADHLVFLTITGEVYTAGNSEHGQLGRISKYNSCRGGRRGCDMILVPGLVRFPKRKELSGHKQIEDIWTTSYCTFLKVKDSDLIVGFGLNNCFQLGCIDAENRYQPDVLANLKFESKLKKVIGGMHHTLFLDQNGMWLNYYFIFIILILILAKLVLKSKIYFISGLLKKMCIFGKNFNKKK